MHRTTDQFRERYRPLPVHVQILADKCFQLLKENPRHPSLQLKKVGDFWSARVGLAHRALAIEDDTGFVWVWIGCHADYERMTRERC